MTFRRTHPLFMLILFGMLFFFSCDRGRFFEDNKVIKKGVWDRNEKVRFEIAIPDTISRYSFFLNVRNDLNYPYSNLYLFILTTHPDGALSKDTLECELADYSGKWFGKGIGSVKFNRFLFRKGIRFRTAGLYIFELEQAMRVKELTGIRDIGLRVEKEK